MSLARNLLGERRKRAIATILGHCESKVYPHLSAHTQAELRAKVIAAISDYHDTVVDILKAATVEEQTVLNDEALRLIDRLNTGLAKLDRISRDT